MSGLPHLFRTFFSPKSLSPLLSREDRMRKIRERLETRGILVDPSLEWRYIVMHHSLTRDGKVVDWTAIRHYHKNVKGWRDIGYHLGAELVGDHMTLQAGRNLMTTGAHAKGFNSMGIGICCVGNFDKAKPSEELWDFIVPIVTDLMAWFEIPREKVIGHRETYAILGQEQQKSCPGNFWDMNALRRRIG